MAHVPVMQRDNEHGRVVVDGKRVDGGGQCTLVAVHERTPRRWVLYPHGVEKLGVELSEEDASALALGIIQSSQ